MALGYKEYLVLSSTDSKEPVSREIADGKKATELANSQAERLVDAMIAVNNANKPGLVVEVEGHGSTLKADDNLEKNKKAVVATISKLLEEDYTGQRESKFDVRHDSFPLSGIKDLSLNGKKLGELEITPQNTEELIKLFRESAKANLTSKQESLKNEEGGLSEPAIAKAERATIDTINHGLNHQKVVSISAERKR